MRERTRTLAIITCVAVIVGVGFVTVSAGAVSPSAGEQVQGVNSQNGYSTGPLVTGSTIDYDPFDLLGGVGSTDSHRLDTTDGNDGGSELAAVEGQPVEEPTVQGETLELVDGSDGETDDAWTFEHSDETIAEAPTIDGGTAYFASRSLYAIDVETGEPEWTFDEKTVSEPPTVVGGVAFVGGDGQVTALDAETGEELWTYEAEQRVDSTTVAGDAVYVAESRTVDVGDPDPVDEFSYTALNATDGEVRWEYGFESGGPQGPPVVDDDTVYSSTGGTLLAINATSGSDRWNESESFDSGITTPTVDNGAVYVGDHDRNFVDDEPGVVENVTGQLHAVDPGDGSIEWTYEAETIERDQFTVSALPTVADDTAYFTAGNVSAVDVDDGSEAWAFETDTVTRNVPTVAGDELYVGVDESLYALDAGDGTPAWSYEPDVDFDVDDDVLVDTLGSAPTVDSGTVYTAYRASAGDGFDDDPSELAAYLTAVGTDHDESSTDSRVDLRTLGHSTTPAKDVDPDGDGDFESIQAAVDAAEFGDTIVVADGVYEESVTVDVPHLELRAADGATPVLDGNDTIEDGFQIEAPSVTVDGFQFEGYTGTGGAHLNSAISISGASVTVTDSTVTDSELGMMIDGGDARIEHTAVVDNERNGIELRGPNAEIVDSEVSDNGDPEAFDDFHGIEISPSPDGLTVANSSIQNNAEMGIGKNHAAHQAHDVVVVDTEIKDNGNGGLEVNNNATVTGNTISDNGDVTAIDVRGESAVTDNEISGPHQFGIDGSQDSVIDGNTITGVEGIAIRVDGERTAVDEGTTVRNNTVSATGSNNWQSATALELDTTGVLVENNSFDVGVAVSEHEDLDEEPHEMTENTVGGDPLVYAANETAPEIDPDAAQVILVNVADATVSDFEFDGAPADVQVSHSDDIEISDNEFTQLAGELKRDPAPIAIYESASVTVDDNQLDELGGADNAILLEDTDEATLSNNVIAVTDDDGGTDGIDITSGESIDVLNNSIEGANNGITTTWTLDELRVENNTVSDVSSNGIDVETENGSIVDNDVTTTDDYGIDLGVSNTTVASNTVTDVSGGIRFDFGHGNDISNNVITGSDSYGIYAPSIDPEHEDTIADNVIQNSGDADEFGGEEALYVGSNSDELENLTVVRNAIENSEGDGVSIVDDAVDLTFTENTIEGSGDDGLRYLPDSDTETDLDARDNYWGDESGPSGDEEDPETGEIADGSGDSIFVSNLAEDAGVRFDPWLITADGLSFAWEPATPESSEEVTFEAAHADAASSEIVEYRWDFTGNDSYERQTTEAETTWEYDEIGTYDVSLTVEFDDGTTDTKERSVSIVEIPSDCAEVVTDGDSIQSTLDDAEAGENICVDSGTYAGELEITDPITLQGLNPDDPPVIDGAGEDSTAFDVDSATDVRIDTFDIVNIADWNYGLYGEEATNVTVSNVSVSEMEGWGIGFSESSEVTIEDSSVSGMYMGLGIWESGDVTISNVDVSAAPHGSYGIELYEGDTESDTTVRDSHVTGATEAGIWISGGESSYADSITVTNTSLEENEVAIANDIEGGTVSATDNWWGDSTGPSGDVEDPETGAIADGDGDDVSENVTFDPHLESPPTQDEPHATFDYAPAELEPGDTVTLDASDSTSPESIEEYRWDLTGDGEIDETTTDPETTHSFDEAGEQDVTLTVEDEAGETDTVTEEIIVDEPDEAVELGGTVTADEDGSAIDGAQLTLLENATTEEVASDVTADDGTYELEADEPGMYDLLVQADGYEDAFLPAVDLVDEETVDVDLETPSVSVTIDSTTSPVTEGETLVVDVTVENLDDESLTRTLELVDDEGALVDETSVDVDAGDDKTVDLEWETDDGDAGNRTLTVATDGDSDTAQVEVTEHVPAWFEVTIDSWTSPVTEGDPLDVTATIENVGDEPGEQHVELLVGDESVDGTDVELSAGATETIVLEWETDEDDVGDHDLTVVSANDTAERGAVVEEVDLGLYAYPSSPMWGETVTFHSVWADDPTWEFDDGTGAKGETVSHAFDTFGTYNVTATAQDGRQDTIEVTATLPTISEDDLEDPDVFSIGTPRPEQGGTPLAGVPWEETFSMSVNGVGEVDHYEWELGETVIETDEPEATFDLGELDSDTQLEVTVVAADGDEYEESRTVTVTERPSWLEDHDGEEFEVDRERGEITTGLTLDETAESFEIQAVPMSIPQQEIGGAPVAVFTYDTDAVGATVYGDAEFEAKLLDTELEAEAEVDGEFDSDLEVEYVTLAGHADVTDIPGPGLTVDPPIVSEVGIGTKFDVYLGAEAELDSELELEEGTVSSGGNVYGGVYLWLLCDLDAEVYGGVEAAYDLDYDSTTEAPLGGEYEVGANLLVDCRFFDTSSNPSWDGTFGDDSALALEADFEDEDGEIEWEIGSKGGDQPFAGDGSAGTLASATGTQHLDDPAGAFDRLTDRPYEDTQPAIAAVDDDLVVAWSTQDADKNVTDGQDLRASTYDADADKWLESEAITDDYTDDESPALATTDDATIAVWSTVNETFDEDAPGVDGPADLFPHYEIAYAVDDGDGWSEPELLTETDEQAHSPSVAQLDDSWVVAWESDQVDTGLGNDTSVQYAEVETDGTASDATKIEDATVPAVGDDGDGASLAYATIDEDGAIDQVVTERIDDEGRTELSRHDAGNVTDVTTADERTIWIEERGEGGLFEAGEESVTELTVGDDVHGIADLDLVTSGDDAVLSYRAMMDDSSRYDLGYRLDRGDGWIQDRAYAGPGDENHTAWHADLAVDDDGFHSAFAIQKQDQNASNDVFVADHEFRPAFDLSANTTAAAAGENATVSYDLRNVGDVATDDAFSVVIENASDAVATVDHDGLEPSETVSDDIEVPVDEDGAFDLRVDHDEEDAHEGTEETTVVAATPSLSIGTVSIERVDDEEIAVEAAVENEGGAAVSEVPVAFEDGNQTVGSDQIDTVGPNETATTNATIDLTSVNTSVVDRVVLDPDDELGADEIDAGERPTWFVQPDLEVGGVEYVEANESVTAEVVVGNHGDGPADATIRVVDDGDGTELGAANATLEPATDGITTYETVPVSLEGDADGQDVTVLADAETPDADPSTTGLSDRVGPVHEADRPAFQVAIDSLDEEIEDGDDLDVGVTVENVGSETDTQSITLLADDSEVDAVDVELEPGSSTTETLTVDDVDLPSIDVLVRSLTSHDGGTVDVSAVDDSPAPGPTPSPGPGDPDPEPATFVVEEFLTQDELTADDELSVEVLIENTGEVAGTGTVSFDLDGETVDQREIELDSEESTELTATLADDLSAGEYDVGVTVGDDQERASLAVKEEPDDAVDDADDATADDGIPGFTIPIGITVLLGATLYAVGRVRR